MSSLSNTEKIVLAAIRNNLYQDYKSMVSVFKTLEGKGLITLILDEQGNVIIAQATPLGKKLIIK